MRISEPLGCKIRPADIAGCIGGFLSASFVYTRRGCSAVADGAERFTPVAGEGAAAAVRADSTPFFQIMRLRLQSKHTRNFVRNPAPETIYKVRGEKEAVRSVLRR